MRQYFEYESEKYGTFIIEVHMDKSYILWDFYSEGDGLYLDEDNIQDELEFIGEDCDVQDFSDLPKDGAFPSPEAAKEYLEKKFGELQ